MVSKLVKFGIPAAVILVAAVYVGGVKYTGSIVDEKLADGIDKFNSNLAKSEPALGMNKYKLVYEADSTGIFSEEGKFYFTDGNNKSPLMPAKFKHGFMSSTGDVDFTQMADFLVKAKVIKEKPEAGAKIHVTSSEVKVDAEFKGEYSDEYIKTLANLPKDTDHKFSMDLDVKTAGKDGDIKFTIDNLIHESGMVGEAVFHATGSTESMEPEKFRMDVEIDKFIHEFEADQQIDKMVINVKGNKPDKDNKFQMDLDVKAQAAQYGDVSVQSTIGTFDAGKLKSFVENNEKDLTKLLTGDHLDVQFKNVEVKVDNKENQLELTADAKGSMSAPLVNGQPGMPDSADVTVNVTKISKETEEMLGGIGVAQFLTKKDNGYTAHVVLKDGHISVNDKPVM